MPNVEIIGPAPSTYTRAVRMVCEEKSIPYDLKQSPPHSTDVDAIHPFGKVPVMRHGDFELCESKAIATYLDLTFPGPKLIPTDPRHAALTEQWVSLVNTKNRRNAGPHLFAQLYLSERQRRFAGSQDDRRRRARGQSRRLSCSIAPLRKAASSPATASPSPTST